MGVAQHNARPHADELIREVQPRLKHLLVKEDHPLALRGGHDGDRHGVGRERGPRLILELRHMPAEIILHDARLIGRHDEIVTLDLAADPQAFETHERAAKVLHPRAFDTQRRTGDRSEADERAHFDVIRSDLMGRPPKRSTTVDRVDIRTDPLNASPECHEKAREILHVRFTGRVPQHGAPLGCHGSDEGILRGRYAGLV